MDLSSYFEDKFDSAMKNSSMPELIKAAEEISQDPIELTNEENKKFYPFDINPDFIGSFSGAGQVYKFNGHIIKTWAFKDSEEKTWFIPQWHTMDDPQLDFEGFSKEIPGKYIYNINYLGKLQTGSHNLKIFRKHI